jgi:hypothetical protein
MTPEQRAAFLMSQVACMQATLAGMQARNMADRAAGRPVTHQPHEFDALPDQYGLGHNSAITYLQG